MNGDRVKLLSWDKDGFVIVFNLRQPGTILSSSGEPFRGFFHTRHLPDARNPAVVAATAARILTGDEREER
ncbi:MAG TPA: hypothetical protein VKA46_08730 [Gemmataceae bacterium]|nr:hypothetical protein [Gemmataceae bacterium]